MKEKYIQRLPEILAFLIEILAVCIWMFPGIIHRNFYVDWYNHKWLMIYYGEYFKCNFEFPVVINTDSVVGIMYPAYYGDLLYKALAIFYIVLGSARKALLLSAGIILLAQTELWRRVFKIYTTNQVSLALTVFWLFSIYPGTNYFIRSALTEFYAVCLLNILVALWILMLYSRNQVSYWCLIGIGISFLFYIHPITAMYGTIFFIILIIITFRKLNWGNHKIYLFCAGGITLMAVSVVMPFLHLMLHQNPSANLIGNVQINSESIDGFFARLSAVPFDIRVYQRGIETSTPNLSAAINMILFSINLCLSVKNIKNEMVSKRKKFNIILLDFTIIILIVISTTDRFGRITSILFRNMQFIYRVVSYIDLCIICGVVYNLSICGGKKPAERKEELRVMLACGFALLLQMVVIRYYQIDAIGDKCYPEEQAYLMENPEYVPGSFYGISGYEIHAHEKVGGYSDVDWSEVESIAFDVTISSSQNGGVKSIITEEEGWLSIKMYSHPWNHIYLDGKRYSGDYVVGGTEFAVAGTALQGVCIYIGGTGEHLLEYRYEPDEIYLIEQNIARGCVCALLLALIASVMYALRKRCFSGQRPYA